MNIVLIIITVLIISGLIIGRYLYKRKKKLCLYKDYIIVIDNKTETDPVARIAFIIRIMNDNKLKVRLPALNDRKCIVKWDGTRNNFFIIDFL